MPWLYRRPDSRFWWIAWREPGGRQKSKSTGCEKRKEAALELERQQALWKLRKSRDLTRTVVASIQANRRDPVTLSLALAGWTQEAEDSTARNTVAKYLTLAERLREFFCSAGRDPSLSELTPDRIREFLKSRRASIGVSTWNQERKILAGFFERCVRNDLMDRNPVREVKPLREEEDRTRRRPFTLAELARILDQAPTPFWRYMVIAGFFTWQRMGDLICLTCGAFDLRNGLVRLTARKTGRRLVIPLHPRLRSTVEELKEVRGPLWQPADFIWPEEARRYQARGAGTFSNEFYDVVLVPAGLVPARESKGHRKKGSRAAPRRVQAVSFHSIRHSAVSIFRALEGNQAVAKELAGHSTDQMSEHYTSLPIETLRSGIERLPSIEGKDA